MKNFLPKRSEFAYRFLLMVGMLLTSFIAYAQPPNDNCANATLFSSRTSCSNIAGTLINANPSLVTGCGNVSSPDVYYSFVARFHNPVITLSSVGADFTSRGVRIQLLTACGGTSLACATTTTLNATGLAKGSTYIKRVTTNSAFAPPTSGTYGFNICVTDRIQIDFSKSYINVTDGAAGGTINPSDILEIRGTFVVIGDNTLPTTNVSFFDTLRLGAGLNSLSTLASRTNEGKVYRSFTTPTDADAGGAITLAGLDTAIRINLGVGAAPAAGGSIASNTRPSFSNSCIIVAPYLVRVNGSFGTKINIGGGAFRYTVAGTNYTFSFPRDSLIVYETLTACSDAASPGNLIGTANNGTFGTLPMGSSPAGLQNAGPATDINTSYVYQPIGVGPQDYFYARPNNTSPSNSIIQTAPKPDATRTFNVFDITGDHTGAADPAR